MQNFSLKTVVLLGSMSVWMLGCNKENVSSASSGLNQNNLTAVGQTSAQLASGTSFSITASTSGSSGLMGACPHGHGPAGMGSLLEGTDFLTPTNELIAIVDAESAGDMRGIRMLGDGGAKITWWHSHTSPPHWHFWIRLLTNATPLFGDRLSARSRSVIIYD